MLSSKLRRTRHHFHFDECTFPRRNKKISATLFPGIFKNCFHCQSTIELAAFDFTYFIRYLHFARAQYSVHSCTGSKTLPFISCYNLKLSAISSWNRQGAEAATAERHVVFRDSALTRHAIKERKNSPLPPYKTRGGRPLSANQTLIPEYRLNFPLPGHAPTLKQTRRPRQGLNSTNMTVLPERNNHIGRFRCC